MTTSTHPYTGKNVIVRSYDSGVHFGMIKDYDPTTRHVTLSNARRLYLWRGFTLSEVSQNGMTDENAKISQFVPEMIIMNVIELIPTSEKATLDLSEYPAYIPVGGSHDE